MSFKVLSDYHLPLDGTVEPDIDTLEYNVKENHPEWRDIARQYPNLTSLVLKTRGDRQASPELFSNLPRLKSIYCGGHMLTLEDLDVAHMQHIEHFENIKFDDVRVFTVLTGLPKLNALFNVTFCAPKGDLVAAASNSLSKLYLVLEQTEQLSIDMRDATALSDFSMSNCRYQHRDQPLPVLSLGPVQMPASVDKCNLDLEGEVNLSGPLLSPGTQARELDIRGRRLNIAHQALGQADSIKDFSIICRDASVLPEQLFNGSVETDRAYLSLTDTRVDLSVLLNSIRISNYLQVPYSPKVEILKPIVQPQLQRLCIDHQALSKLEWLSDCPRLIDLELSELDLNQDSSLLTRLVGLKELELNSIEGEELPASIRTHANLETLSLNCPKLKRLGQLGEMKALSRLFLGNPKHFGGESYQLPELESIAQLPNLSSLGLYIYHQNEATAASAAVLASLSTDVDCGIRLHNAQTRGEQLTKELQILQSSNLSDEQKRHYWQVLLATTKLKALIDKAEQLDAAFYLTFMEAKYTPLKPVWQNWLVAHAAATAEQRPLTSDSVIFVCGKSSFKASELTQKGQEMGFTLAKKFSPEVTHILLGSNPKQTQQLDPQKIIDEGVLKRWFEQQTPQFLQQSGSEAMVENLLAMLASPDEASHKVAVSMLEQGGVTQALLMPLFLVLKTTSDKALRKSIQALLAGQGDGEFQLAVADRVFFENDLRGLDWENAPKGEGPMFKKLKGLPKRWGHTLVMDFAKAYFDRYQEGLLWVLIQKQECEQRGQIISELVEGECLNWHKGCGFANVLQGADEQRLIHCHDAPDIYMQHQYDLGEPKTRLPQTLPTEQRITELDLHNCYLGVLPANFEYYTDVRKLNLHFNHLEALPAKLARLTELEELDISFNHFTEFPAVLFKLKKLKRLDIRRAVKPLYRWGYDVEQGYASLRAPQSFKNAFPDCEILEDE